MRKALVFAGILGAFLTVACGLQPAPKPGPRVAAAVTVEGVDVGGLARDGVAAALQGLAAARYQPPVNARFADGDGTVMPDKAGRLLDVTATTEAALAAPAGSALPAAYSELEAAVTAADLAAARPAGSYATTILDASPGRMENIRLTAALLNNAAIAAGEEFSFNSRTGEPTRERGFRPAVIFVDGGHGEEVGGGMCQVSSTLYNAVLAAGLRVTERHPHSRPVSYVPPGRDATTYTDKDLRFVNTSRRTLVLRCYVAEKKLAVDIFALPGDA
ncbi:VanW family protein [Anaeroselena agilis]|uniref:VanW family protein n=1 Tax=Anaeroselena agilis TaxID=3063788 RepID=A0ABU3P1A1_9FIRM|nr:VanW family protein [Selenomonadales bacterium 4137-cl]